MWKSWLVAAGCLCCLALEGCNEPSMPEGPRKVRTATVMLASQNELPWMTGHVAAHTSINASFRVGGRIIERRVSVGAAVRRGDVLARLDDVIQKDALRAAQAGVADAGAALVQAQQNARRMDNLYKIRSVSQHDQEAATRALKSARAQNQVADAKLHEAYEQLSFTTLYAAADGVVVDRLHESGEVVAAGQPVFRLAGNDGRDAVLDLPASWLEHLASGSTLQICLDTDRSKCSAAVVEEVAPEADATTRTYRVRAHIASPDGMPLGATIVGRTEVSGSGTAMQVPASALFDHRGKPAVWRLNMPGSTVSLVPVEILRHVRESVIVTSGVSAGDTVIAAGTQVLREGQKVEALGDVRP